jgi:hypothetical protein
VSRKTGAALNQQLGQYLNAGHAGRKRLLRRIFAKLSPGHHAIRVFGERDPAFAREAAHTVGDHQIDFTVAVEVTGGYRQRALPEQGGRRRLERNRLARGRKAP